MNEESIIHKSNVAMRLGALGLRGTVAGCIVVNTGVRS